MKLPVDDIEKDFLQALSHHRIVLTAPTGSGKSTRVPRWCHQQHRGKVLVIEPRRVACRTLCSWVAKGLNSRVGDRVGYSVRFENKRGPQTDILFVTPGVARNFLLSQEIFDFETIVFDEFHERSWETDALLAVLASEPKSPQLVIMSATLEAEILAERYDAKLLQAGGRAYPVDIDYVPDPDSKMTLPSSRELVARVSKAVRESFRPEESTLVFLPGLSEMRKVAQALKGLPVTLLHGTFSAEEQALAFEDSPKVILATNVAESSLTVPGVTTVVDCGLEKRTIHQAGYVALATVPIAQSSADQRAGRAGRTAPGRCLRLWSQRGQLEVSKPPDIQRSELDELLLFLAATERGLKTPLRWMESPPEFAWDRALERLQIGGLIGDELSVTELGQAVARLPVDWDWGRLLHLAPAPIQQDLCDICALASARKSPWKNRVSEDQELARKADLGENLWARTIRLLRVGEPAKHGLETDSLRICRQVADDLRKVLRLSKKGLVDTKPAKGLQEFLAAHWPERHFVRRKNRQAWGNGSIECTTARGEELSDDVDAAVFLTVSPILGRKNKVELQARWGLPVRLSTLRRAGYGEPEFEKLQWRQGILHARVAWHFAGRKLGSEETALAGSDLRKALVQLACDGRWQKEGHQQLGEQIFYEELRCGLEATESPVRCLETLFAERLAELGVEDCADLELIESSDFRWEFVADYQLEELKEKYPRQLSFLGAPFRMDYFPKRKLVIMNSLSKSKGLKLNPQHLPRWNSWRVELDERGRRTKLR